MISPYYLFQQLKELYDETSWQNYTTSRILLIHSPSDNLILVEKCYQNSSILSFESQNIVLFESGGHNQVKNELGIISTIHNFLSKKEV